MGPRDTATFNCIKEAANRSMAISSLRKVHESRIILIELTKLSSPSCTEWTLGREREGERRHACHHGHPKLICIVAQCALLSNLATICRNIRLNQQSQPNNAARRGRPNRNRRYCLKPRLNTHVKALQGCKTPQKKITGRELQLFAECNVTRLY